MDASASAELVSGKRRRGYPFVHAAVQLLDAALRQQQRVGEFTPNAECILRLQVARETMRVTLPDATIVSPGDRIVHLHLWNEQFPRMADDGPTLAWARRVNRVFDMSLRELAAHVARSPALDDVVAFRMILGLGVPRQRRQLLSIMCRYGFVMVPMPEPSSLVQRARRLGENMLISMIVLAYNPMALRCDSLRRDRIAVYLSRRALERRYGRGGIGDGPSAIMRLSGEEGGEPA